MAFCVKYQSTEQLLAIAEDGIIDEKELPVYGQIVSDLDGIIAAAMQIKFVECDVGAKKDRPTAASVRRPVQGLASENECRNIISSTAQNASPFLRKGAKL